MFGGRGHQPLREVVDVGPRAAARDQRDGAGGAGGRVSIGAIGAAGGKVFIIFFWQERHSKKAICSMKSVVCRHVGQ